jgi:thymidylate synthase
MNKLDKDYIDLLNDILARGNNKGDRTGTGTMSVFAREIKHNMNDGFPLLTTKKMAWKTMITELLWFLHGDTNIQFLVQNNCNIWNGDAYKNFKKAFESKSGDNIIIPPFDYINEDGELLSIKEFAEKIKTDDDFAKKWGELGPIYGHQWRKWFTGKEVSIRDGSYPNGEFKWKQEEVVIDQLANLVNDLKNNPDSRRLMVTAWNPADLPKQILPPCHYGFQCYTRVLTDEERVDLYNKKINLEDPLLPPLSSILDFHNIPTRALSLKWIQRSCDFPLGIPVNIASYGLLLLLLSKITNMVPEELIGSFGDSHIYLNQINGANEQVLREGFKLPIVEISDREVTDLRDYNMADIKLIDYVYHPKIDYPLSN